MKINKTHLFVFSLLSLNACSSIPVMSDMFISENETPPLKGERISVLELQKTLKVDTPANKDEKPFLPKSWQNPAWPQAGGFPNHSMQNLAFSDNTPKKLWSIKAGRASRGDLPLNSPPIIADNRVFTLDTKTKLYAFDANSGAKIWSRDVGSLKEKEDVITGGVAYAHKTLFVTNGYDEALALSPEDGEILWRKTLPSPSRAAPTIIADKVYISTTDSRLIALNAADGSGLWEYRGVGETAGLLGAASPAASKNIVIGVFSSGEITALRTENGSVAWSDNLSSVNNSGGGLESISDITAMPVMHQGIVIAMSYSGKIAAIDERSGIRIWQREIGGTRTPLVAGSALFVLSSENQLIGMNLSNGSIFWIKELERFENEKHMKNPLQWSSPVMAENRLILVSSNGILLEINPDNGDIINKTKIKDKVRLAPALANNTLYMLSENGKLSAYR